MGDPGLFSGLQVGVASASAAAPAAAPVDDMFGGLSLSSCAAAPPAAAAVAPVAAQAAAPLDDLFSGLSGPAPAAAPAVAVTQQAPPHGSWLHQPAVQQQPLQQQQHAPVQMQSLGTLPLGGPGVGAKPASMAPGSGYPAPGSGGSLLRGLSGSHSGSGSGSHGPPVGAAQQPWSGGITKDHPAFNFVLDEFSKK